LPDLSGGGLSGLLETAIRFYFAGRIGLVALRRSIEDDPEKAGTGFRGHAQTK
jgi:hypothetical protein